MNRFFTLLFLLALTAGHNHAQTTAGTEFWLGYMENLDLIFNGAPSFAVIISAEGPTTGAVEVPATGLSIPFTVGAGTTEITLPAAIWYSETSEQVDNKGIRIVSTQPVRVQAYHYRIFFNESSNLLPTTELGSDYLVTAMTDDLSSDPSSFVVVATEDNTELEITPSTLTLGLRPAGVPFTVTLNEGQNYQVQATGDLSGTNVRSLTGSPIAVFAGSQQSYITAPGCLDGSANSHVWDQTLPLEDWRDLYYFVPFAGQGGDRLKILAAGDDTEVFFDCELVAILNTGEVYETQREPATVISATGPISVSQYNNGYSCEPQDLGDPNGLSYLAAEYLGTNFRWNASEPGAPGFPQFEVHWMTVLGPEENFGGLTLDGLPVTNTQPFPGDPSWRYAQVSVGEGEHQLLAQAGVQAYAYGFGFADAYTNNLGYGFAEPQEYACLEIDREGILCVDSLQNFTYTSNLNLAQFAWTFGDGEGSLEEFPIHSYDAPGEYEVNLLAIAANGTTVTASLIFEVFDCGDDPCAGETVSISLATEGNTCANYLQAFEFTANFTPNTISWDFGDGTPSVDEAAPEHFFSLPGNYTVTLSLTSEVGCIFTESINVNIVQCPPCFEEGVSPISITGELCVGESLVFDADYNAAGIPLFIVEWTFSDGQFFDTELATVSFSEPGDYSVFYMAINTEGCFFDGALDFTIEACEDPCDNLPSLTIDAPQSPICVLIAEEFFAITDAELVSYEWFVNEELRAITPTLTYSFVLTGPQLITLNAIDINGCEYVAFYKLFVEDCQTDCPDLSITDVIIDGELCVDSLFSITIEAESEAQNFTLWTLSQTELILNETLDDLSFSTPGLYAFDFLTFAGPGCVIDSTITVNIVDCSVDCTQFQLAGFDINGELCVDSPISIIPVIDADLASSLWTLPNGVTTTELTLQDITFNTPGTADFQLQLIDQDGCQIDTTLQLIIEACEDPCDNLPTLAIGATLSEVCVLTAIEFFAITDAELVSYEWFINDISTSDLEIFSYSFLLTGAQLITLMAEDVNGCEYTAFYKLSVNDCQTDCPDLAIADVIINGDLCIDSLFSITIEAESVDNNFTIWTLSQTELIFSRSLNDLSFSTPGIYSFDFLTFAAPGCFIDSTITVNVVDCSVDCSLFQLDGFAIDGELCIDSPISITPLVDTDLALSLWTLPNGVTSTELTLQDITFNSPGTANFQLQLIDQNGCQIDTTLQLIIEACEADCSAFELNGFNIAGVNCVDSLINISPIFNQEFTELSWTLPDGSIINDFSLTDLSFPLPGEVDLALQILNEEGCSIDFTLQLTIEECTTPVSCEVMFPNIFSPNGDNLNDRFQAFFAPECEPVSYDLMIFNRWGNKIYESSNPGEGWDGTFNGKAHPQEVLVYICQLTFSNGVSQEFKGDVTLIR